MSDRGFDPLARALVDWHAGERDHVLMAERDDGDRSPLDVGVFFRAPHEFEPAETTALELSSGRVLDVGAGAGCHALALQDVGLSVTALDVCPGAVEVMRARGVDRPVLGSLASIEFDSPFDTILVLMNGLGLAGTAADIPGFVARLRSWLAPGGRILIDSTDLRLEPDPGVRSGIAARTAQGRHWGDVSFRLHYRGMSGARYPWVFQSVGELTEATGGRARLVFQEAAGHFLVSVG